MKSIMDLEDELAKALIEMIETASYPALKLTAEFIIKDCGNSDCSSCKQLKSLIEEIEKHPDKDS